MVNLGRLVQEVNPLSSSQEIFFIEEDGTWRCSCGVPLICSYTVLLDSDYRPKEGMGSIQATCGGQPCSFQACWQAQDFKHLVPEFTEGNGANFDQDTVMRENIIVGDGNFTGVHSPNVHVNYQPVSFVLLQEFSSPFAREIPFSILETYSGQILPQEDLYGRRVWPWQWPWLRTNNMWP
ncbi:unnamed protein product [Clonostachys rosea]|uniref:Uncharacterized protein n=1 Tax=Bionectria ochroleuca TaxID=29856 RepID=A0ABY6UAY0_BIOOC|nr:unnamed protein product [Clonostachys rosea]